MYRQIEGGVTAAAGFLAAHAAAGIKYKTGRDDMALLYSKTPCRAAGTFTTNVVKAAPVKWDKELLLQGEGAQAVVINAGIANACTGEEGMQVCRETAEAAGELLRLKAEQVFVASTGVIGMPLPMDKIKAGITMLAADLKEGREAGALAARAIMTTDTLPKEAAVTFVLGGKTVTLGGMCKGSGMIHPNMCTMLSFLTTDAAISGELLQKALSETVADTYNMISVDGDTSTNDTVLLLANGMAGNEEICKENEDYQTFKQALFFLNETLAKKIAADGEGATRLFTAKVVHATDKREAVNLAKAVITSNLTKAAIFGKDANWGRILCALGYAGESFDPERVDLYLESAAGSCKLVENGKAADYSEEEATKLLSESEITVTADMKQGEASATAWGCDLTFDYVKINADYRS